VILERIIQFRLNGENCKLTVPASHTLLDVLRNELSMFGTRESCGIGMCGACTVLVNGKLLSACLLLAAQVDGSEVVTIEGFGNDGQPDPIQQAFIDYNAFQCSYCTPGMILTAKALLDENPAPDAEQIKEFFSGNLCRCGSYVKIITAVLEASRYFADH